MPYHRLLAGLVIPAICSTSAPAQQIAYDSTTRSWTLVSGPVSYRLLRRVQQVRFDYFGPTSRIGPPVTTLPANQLRDSTSLRLVSVSIVQLSTGVPELRLHLSHVSIP